MRSFVTLSLLIVFGITPSYAATILFTESGGDVVVSGNGTLLASEWQSTAGSAFHSSSSPTFIYNSIVFYGSPFDGSDPSVQAYEVTGPDAIGGSGTADSGSFDFWLLGSRDVFYLAAGATSFDLANVNAMFNSTDFSTLGLVEGTYTYSSTLSGSSANFDIVVQAVVPEPSRCLLLVIGMTIAGACRRR